MRTILVCVFVSFLILLGVFLEVEASENILEKHSCYFNKKHKTLFTVDEVVGDRYLTTHIAPQGYKYAYGELSNSFVESEVKEYIQLFCGTWSILDADLSD